MSGRTHQARKRHLAVLAASAVLAALTPVATLLAPPSSVANAAPSATWTRTAVRPDADRPLSVEPSAATAYRLDRAALLDELASGVVEVPDPDGDLVAFRIEPTSVMEAELAAAHPELQSWAGTAVDGAATIRLDATPGGVHASVRGGGPAWYVDPAYRDDDSLHLSYLGADLPVPQRGLVEPPLPARTRAQATARADTAPSLGEGPGAVTTLRTYRLALLSDPSFAAYTAPGANQTDSDNAVLAAKVVLVDRLDQIYGADLSIKLVLVNGTDTKLNLWTAAEATGANGPCGLSACYPSAMLAAGCTLPVLDRNRWVVGQLIGARNYDVGHLALGTNGGGIAYLDAVGGPTKAGGCTGLTAPSGDAYAVDYLAHELGHQFGADHTFEGADDNCAGTRAAGSAVEPGSGSTIMGYAGICAADDLQSHSDPVFSAVSRDAVDAFVGEVAFAESEWQSVALSQFDGTDSFNLQIGAATTSTITRGSTYTAAGIKAALLAILPAGSQIQVRPFFDEFSFDERGFSIYYVLYGSSFAADVPEPTVVPVSGSFGSAVNDIDAGNPSATSGGTPTTTTNHNPTVNAGLDRTIPVRTPFALTGSASDADAGDALGYVWEQADLSGSAGGTLLSTQPKTAGPLFRVFGTASSSFANSPGAGGLARSFPDLAQVLAGNTNADTGSCPAAGVQVDCLSEWLPTAAYTGSALHFRLTARDSSTQAGGVASDDVTLTLDKTKGPFRVTSQATTPGTPYAGGSTQTVTWTTGTSTLAANVRITLSTDGGVTFPHVLAASTANNGSAQVTLPNATTGSARIRVEAIDNYFYDVNDAPFAIQSAGGPAPLVVDRSSVPATWNTQLTDPASVSFSASGGASTPTASTTALPAGLALSPGGSPWTISGTPTAPPGSYPATVTVTSGAEQVQFAVAIVVAAEDSAVVYTGPTSVVGPDPDADAVPVTMTARVTQAGDGALGQIGAATVTFTDTTTGTDLCAAAPVATSGTGPGTATCSFDADLSAAFDVTYQVALTVGGSYRGSSGAATTVTVALPDEPDPVLPETTITGGPSGWLLASQATFGLGSSVPGSTFSCRLDGVKVGCDGGSVTVTGLTQRAHRLSVVAEDQDGNRDETAATRDFAVPVDDTGLTTSGRWRHKRSGSAYLGTYSQARRKGAALTYRVNAVRELALLVRTGKRYGAVRVYLDDALLATVRTRGPAGSRAARVGHFATPRSGTVRIVTTSGATVRVDGLGVSTYAF